MQIKQKKLLICLLLLIAVTICLTALIFLNRENKQTARAATAVPKPYFTSVTTNSGGPVDYKISEDKLTISLNIDKLCYINATNIPYYEKDRNFTMQGIAYGGYFNVYYPGRHICIFRLKEGYEWSDGDTNPIYLTVNAYGSLENAEIQPISSYTYDGKEKKPLPTLTYRGSVLPNGGQIQCSYKDNVNAGTATVTAVAVGGSFYEDRISTTFTINKANITPSITSALTAECGKGLELTCSGNTGNGEVSWTVEDDTGKATVDGSTLMPTQIGDVNVTLHIAESDNYNSATKTQKISINRGYLSPDFTYSSVLYGKDSPEPAVTGIDGGGKISWEIINGDGGSATIDKDTGVITPLVTGTVEVTLNVASSTNYFSGKVTKTVKIEKGVPEAAITSLPTVNFGEVLPLTLSGNAGGGEVSWTVQDGTGKAILDGTNLKPTKAGTVTVTLKIAGTPNYAAVTKTQTVTIGKADISPNFNYAFVSYGRNSSAPTITGNAGGGKLTYKVDAGSGCALIDADSGVLTPTKAGIVTVTMTVEESDNYKSATATQTVTIEKGDLNLVITSADSVTFGNKLMLSCGGNAAGGKETWTVTPGTGTANLDGVTLTPTLIGTVTVTLTVDETENYKSGAATRTVTIKEASVPEIPPTTDDPASPASPVAAQGGLSTAALVAIIVVAVIAIAFAAAAIIIAVRKKAEDAGGFYDEIDDPDFKK